MKKLPMNKHTLSWSVIFLALIMASNYAVTEQVNALVLEDPETPVQYQIQQFQQRINSPLSSQQTGASILELDSTMTTYTF